MIAEPTTSRHCRRAGIVIIGGLFVAAIASAGCLGEMEGVASLEQLLTSGHAPDWYARQLESSGYQVTAINYTRKSYAAYEVVKNARSYEVQLQIDTETGTVNGVAVEQLMSPSDDDLVIEVREPVRVPR